MGTDNPLNDEGFSSALANVVWRFHVYGKYNGEQSKAIKTLPKKVPGHSPAVYQEMFESSLKVLIATSEAVEKAPKSPKPGQEFAEFADVDMEYVMGQLRAKFPEQTDDFLQSHIGAAITEYRIIW
jgi:hypothetical protein